MLFEIPLVQSADDLAARLERLRLKNEEIEATRLQVASREMERKAIAAEQRWRREQKGM